MPDKVPLSIFIVAENEADRIKSTLNPAIELAEDVLVVDSGSADGTIEICQELGARVIRNSWSGYGPQKRFAEDNVQCKWLLNLDADEVMSEALVEELRAMFNRQMDENTAWRIPIVEVFPGEKTPRRFAYSLSPVRLYTLNSGRYSESPVHDRVELNPNVTISSMKGRIHHYSIKSIGHEIDKLNAYTDRQVAEMETKDRKFMLPRLLTEFPLAFLKAYFLRRYFLRGRYGFIIAMNYAIFRHLRVAKHMERRMKKSSDS